MVHLVETRHLVSDAVVDAIGAAEDRREELEMQRTESMAGRSTVGRGMTGRGMAGRGTIGRTNYVSSTENKYATKQQVAMLLGLGREILLLLKLLMAVVVVLCVMCCTLIMKK